MRDDDGVSHPKNRRVMKPVKLFYLKNCPFCRKALRYIDEAKAAHPELAAVGIELIEESEQPAVADGYDYYYVPTFYVDGVVCSPLEAGMVKQACGAEFLTVTPGVRFADGDKGDQVRVTTPARARELGSDFIVVGRPITKADDPVAAYRRCVREFLG